VTRARLADGWWRRARLSIVTRRIVLGSALSAADVTARVNARRRGCLVLLAATALTVLSACGATTGLGQTSTSVTGQPGASHPGASDPALRIRRRVPPGIQLDGFETLVKTTTDPSILTAVRTDLSALPPFVAPGSSPCGAANCLVNCPIDFGIVYELTFTDAHGSVQEQATLDAQGCRTANVSTEEGTRRLDDESSPLWTLVSTVLGVPRCTVIQPPVEGWNACHWPSSQAVHATAAPSP
jgi:hypothetical protein